MELDKKLLRIKEYGDISRICMATGISRQTISKAINSKRGSRRVVLAIESYFKQLNK